MMTIRAGDTLIATSLIVTSHGRSVALEALETTYQVRAMVQSGYDPEVSRIFIYSHAARSTVVLLAARRGLITTVDAH